MIVYYLKFILDIVISILPLRMIIVDIYIFSLFLYFKYIENMIIMNAIYHILIYGWQVNLFIFVNYFWSHSCWTTFLSSWNLGLELHVKAFWCHQSALTVKMRSAKCLSGCKPSSFGLLLYIRYIYVCIYIVYIYNVYICIWNFNMTTCIVSCSQF